MQQRGQALFYVGQNRAWTAVPDYEPMPLVLSWSERERCLRLQDLDGAVRYYSAQTGAPASQWLNIPLREGIADVPPERFLRLGR